jgi:hypothetical protein
MTRQEKIKEIMTLAGVGPRDFDKARRNYETLADDEIERRWSKLRHGAEAVDAWRAARAAARPTQQPGQEVGVATEIALDSARSATAYRQTETQRQAADARVSTGIAKPRSNQAPEAKIDTNRLSKHRLLEGWLKAIETSNISIDRDVMAFAKMIERVRRWRPPVRDMVAAVINRQVEHLATAAEASRTTNKLLTEIAAASAAGLDSDDFITTIRQRIHEIAIKNEHLAALTGVASRRVAHVAGVLHPLMPHSDPRLTATATVDALARLENAISDYRPDIIVTVNDEGQSIGKVVVSDLHLDIPVLTVRGSAETKLVWDESIGLQLDSSPVVCVVGHLGRTGITMSATIDLARQRYGTPNVFGIVLASTYDAAEQVRKHGPFLFHLIADAAVIEPSYDTTKDTRIESDSFVFGAESENADKILEVPRAMLDRARKDMKREFPIEPLFWESYKG